MTADHPGVSTHPPRGGFNPLCAVALAEGRLGPAAATTLKQARLAHDPPLRLVDVAQRAGVSVSLVCMVEKGLQSPSREAIARAVGASYGSFWEAA